MELNIGLISTENEQSVGLNLSIQEMNSDSFFRLKLAGILAKI